MTLRFTRLRNLMGTPEGRHEVAKELISFQQIHALSKEELSLLDQVQNWDYYVDSLKKSVKSSQRVLKLVENNVYGNVVEFKRK